MKLHQLRYFVEVALSASIVKASERLYTTPQNISKALIQLEDELGVKLFYRLKNGMFLTDEGLTAFDTAQNIIQQSDKLASFFTGSSKEAAPKIQERLSLLTVPLFIKMVITALNCITNEGILFGEVLVSQLDILQVNRLILEESAQCLQKYDGIIFSVDHDDLKQYIELLKSEYVIYFLYSDHVCLEVRNDDPLSECSVISQSVLETLPILTYTVDAFQPTFIEQIFLKHGVKLRVPYRVPGDDGKKWSALHNSYSIIGSPTNEMYPNIGYKCIPIEGNILTDHLLLVPRDKVSFKPVKLFVKYCDDFFSITKLI